MDVLYTRRAIPILSSPRTTRNSLIIPPTLLDLTSDRIFAAHAKRQVVTATLRCSTRIERFEDDICDTLRGEDVAGTYGCFGRRVEKACLGDADYASAVAYGANLIC